jgi:hypothetical protein
VSARQAIATVAERFVEIDGNVVWPQDHPRVRARTGGACRW